MGEPEENQNEDISPMLNRAGSRQGTGMKAPAVYNQSGVPSLRKAYNINSVQPAMNPNPSNRAGQYGSTGQAQGHS